MVITETPCAFSLPRTQVNRPSQRRNSVFAVAQLTTAFVCGIMYIFEFGAGKKMPYIKIESGKLSDEQKTMLIKRLTEVSAEIMNIPQEFFVTTITELPDKNFGIGGKTIDVIKSEYKR